MKAPRLVAVVLGLCALLALGGTVGGAENARREALAPADIAAAKGAPIPAGSDMVPGQVIVRFKPGRANAAMGQIQQAQNIVHKKARKFRLIDWYLIDVDTPLAVRDVVAQYRQHNDVLYAEPNYRFQAVTDKFPNDTRLSELWGMHNTGQTGARPTRTLMPPRPGPS